MGGNDDDDFFCQGLVFFPEVNSFLLFLNPFCFYVVFFLDLVGWTYNDGKWYKRYETKLNWEDAQANCEREEATLASIHDLSTYK